MADKRRKYIKDSLEIVRSVISPAPLNSCVLVDEIYLSYLCTISPFDISAKVFSILPLPFKRRSFLYRCIGGLFFQLIKFVKAFCIMSPRNHFHQICLKSDERF